MNRHFPLSPIDGNPLGIGIHNRAGQLVCIIAATVRRGGRQRISPLNVIGKTEGVGGRRLYPKMRDNHGN